MGWNKLVIAALVGYCFLWWIPLKLPDPYYHVEQVQLMEWLNRELEELRTGER